MLRECENHHAGVMATGVNERTAKAGERYCSACRSRACYLGLPILCDIHITFMPHGTNPPFILVAHFVP